MSGRFVLKRASHALIIAECCSEGKIRLSFPRKEAARMGKWRGWFSVVSVTGTILQNTRLHSRTPFPEGVRDALWCQRGRDGDHTSAFGACDDPAPDHWMCQISIPIMKGSRHCG